MIKINNKRAKYLSFTVILCVIMFFCPICSVFAVSDAPTQSYTHLETASGAKKSVPMRDVYTPSETFDIRGTGKSQGIEKISDIDCSENGNIYILTSDSQLFVTDSHGKIIKEITVTEDSGEKADFTGAAGIYVYSEEEIYIADTANHRVLKLNGSGKITATVLKPDSGLLPEDFNFAPMKLERDSKGVLYVLCDGAYYGALLFSPANEFIGFYGANSVKGSALTTISYIWDMLTKNDTKRSKSVKKLPFQFLDMYVDSKDFVYTCTGKTTNGISTGQIKKLSPSGTNILFKQQLNGTKTGADGFNFGESITVKRNNKTVNQNFLSIQADERGFIYALDSTFGLIYIYDTDCNLISAFGGGGTGGERAGVFSSPVAMAYNNNKVLVADNKLNTVTVFERTEYGENLLSAQSKTLSADYAGSMKEWKTVLGDDSGSRLALRGIAKAYFSNGDYENALKYAKSGADYVTYGQALEKMQSKFISKNFVWIFLLFLAVLGGLSALAVVTVKKQVVVVRNEKLRIMFRSFLHPFESFNKIRYQQKGSLIIAFAMCLIFFISSIISETSSNFRFTSFDETNSNSLYQLLRTIGIIVLFSLANWAICVLMEGKGTLKLVFTVVSYSVLPLIVYNVLFTILSHLIISPTNALLTGLSTLATIITGIALVVGLMIIHEFSFPKLVGSLILTLFAMILIVFVIFMVGMMLSQLWSFIVTVFLEAVYR